MVDNSFNSYDSRWATEKEIKKSLYKVGIIDNKPLYGGIPLYADADSRYVDETDTHSMIFGSTTILYTSSLPVGYIMNGSFE